MTTHYWLREKSTGNLVRDKNGIMTYESLASLDKVFTIGSRVSHTEYRKALARLLDLEVIPISITEGQPIDFKAQVCNARPTTDPVFADPTFVCSDKAFAGIQFACIRPSEREWSVDTGWLYHVYQARYFSGISVRVMCSYDYVEANVPESELVGRGYSILADVEEVMEKLGRFAEPFGPRGLDGRVTPGVRLRERFQ